MQLNINHTYKFIFIDSAETGNPPPPEDGYYLILQELTYNELLAAGIKGYPESKFQEEKFYKLRNQENDRIIYVPESYMDGHPLMNVRRYPKLVLTFNLGLVNNPSVLDGLKDQIAGTVNNLDSAVFSLPWKFNYTVQGDHSSGTSTLTLFSTDNINPGDILDSSLTAIADGTEVSSVDSSTQITLNQATVDSIAGGTEIEIAARYTVSGDYSITDGDGNFVEIYEITLTDTTNIEEGDAVDDSISAVKTGTKVISVDHSTGVVTLNYHLKEDLADGTQLIIDNPTNEQPEFNIEDCSLMTFDYVWMTDDEARESVKQVEVLRPNPYEQLERYKAENARLRAQVKSLESLFNSLPTS